MNQASSILYRCCVHFSSNISTKIFQKMWILDGYICPMAAKGFMKTRKIRGFVQPNLQLVSQITMEKIFIQTMLRLSQPVLAQMLTLYEKKKPFSKLLFAHLHRIIWQQCLSFQVLICPRVKFCSCQQAW